MRIKKKKKKKKKNHDIKKLPRQIYSKLPKVPFKHFDSKKSVKEFYTRLFKDLSSMLPLDFSEIFNIFRITVFRLF